MTAIEGLMTKHKEEIERLKEQHDMDKKVLYYRRGHHS